MNQFYNNMMNMQMLQQNFQNFARQFMQQNRMSPQQKVQELLNSGQMTQQQFNQLMVMANQIMGRR